MSASRIGINSNLHYGTPMKKLKIKIDSDSFLLPSVSRNQTPSTSAKILSQFQDKDIIIRKFHNILQKEKVSNEKLKFNKIRVFGKKKARQPSDLTP